MRIFRGRYNRKTFISLLLVLAVNLGIGYSKSYGSELSAKVSPSHAAQLGGIHSYYLEMIYLDKQELYELLLIVIFVLLFFILHNFWLHRQRHKLKSLNIILSEQRAEQELILEEKLHKEREMNHLNQVQNRILSIIGHDMRGPLAGMYELFRVYASGEMKVEEEEMDVFLKECYQQLGAVYFLAENLLFWAKNQNEGMAAFPGDYSLHNMAEEAIGLLEQVAASKSIRIKLDIDEDVRVHCDYNQMSSVMRNLVSNSVKFTAKGGNVVISSRSIKDKHVITVSDNGVGMEQNKLDLMIQQRIAYTTRGTDDEPGTGLGISLIAEFVEKNGGKLIGSSRPGNGTSFSFSLPAAPSNNSRFNQGKSADDSHFIN